MVEWTLLFTTHAQKGAKKISRRGLRPKVEMLLEVLKKKPYQTPPPYEKIMGDLAGAYSRRISI